MFVYSGLPWTTIRNECTKWRRWLGSDEAKALSTEDYSSSSFWKGTLPPYRETIYNDDNSIASQDSFHSIEDDKETDGNQFTQDDMILSGSIVNLKNNKVVKGEKLSLSIKQLYNKNILNSLSQRRAIDVCSCVTIFDKVRATSPTVASTLA